MEYRKWKKIIIHKRFINLLFIKKVRKKKKRIMTIYNRSNQVLTKLKGIHYSIHKGNLFKLLKPFRYHSAYKFGEFSFTRKPFFFPKKVKKKKSNLFRR